jgi:hypothetical protein
MMVRNGIGFIKDYIFRTKENYKNLKNGPYEVTALINSMVGFLILPKEALKRKITDTLIQKSTLLGLQKCIYMNTYSKAMPNDSLDQICRHMRNAVAHNRIIFHAEDNVVAGSVPQIHSITFKDGYSAQKFEMTLEVDLLEKFLLEFADGILTQIH